MLTTWTLVVFLNAQPFVYPKQIPTLEECSAMLHWITPLLVPNSKERQALQTSASCGRTDLSVFKPARD